MCKLFLVKVLVKRYWLKCWFYENTLSGYCVLYERVYDARRFSFFGGAEVSFLYGVMIGWGLMGVFNFFFTLRPALYPVMFDVVLVAVGCFLLIR